MAKTYTSNEREGKRQAIRARNDSITTDSVAARPPVVSARAHLPRETEWDAAADTDTYRRSTRGASLEEVGFIHLSDAGQLPRVADFLYRHDAEPLVVLELESDQLLAAGAELRWEDGGQGEDFPHLYGPIEAAWVLAVVPAGFTADGTFAWPI